MKKTLLFLLVLLVGLTTRAESLTPNETFTIEREVGLRYAYPQTISVDFTKALSDLGVSSASDATVIGINYTDGSTVENAMATYDGWRNASGDFEYWGDNAAVCVKFSTTDAMFTINDMGNGNVPAAGSSFTCQWGLKNGDKTYVYQVTVNYVALHEYTFETVKTITVNKDVVEKTSFSGDEATFNVSDVTEALGITDISLCTAYLIKASDGKFWKNYTDGWFDSNGDPATYGAEKGVCVKISDPASGRIDYIGCYDTSYSAGDTFTAKWALVYNDKAVEIDVVLTFVAQTVVTYPIEKTITVNVNETEKTAYSGKTATFDVSEVTTALGVSNIASCSQFIVKVTDGTFVSNSTDGWRDANGDPAGWGTSTGGICVKLSEPSNGIIDYIGCIDQTHVAGETYTAKWAFVYDSKAVVIDVVLTFVPATTPYVTFTEKGVNTQNSYYYATYKTVYPMNVDECEFEAYTVNETGSVLSYEQVKGTVPANTPLLVRATSTGDKEAKLGKLADAVVPTSNSLMASDGTVTGDGSTIYVLGSVNGTLGWYLKTSGSAIAEGKCYLQSTAGVKFIGLDDAATGISAVTTTPAANSAARYSLAGQRVNASYKGIVIENGKKYLIK